MDIDKLAGLGLLREGIILAAIPFFGSIVAFLFEIGKLSVYDVPVTYIQLDFTRIVIASAAVAFASLLIFLLWTLGIGFRKKAHPFAWVVSKVIMLFVFFGTFLVLSRASHEAWLVMWAMIGLLALFDLLPPLFRWKTGKPYWDRLRNDLIAERLQNSAPEANKTFADKILGPLSLLLFGSLFVVMVGNYLERDKTTYWFLDESPNYIVVTNYGDMIVAKSIDRSTGQIGNSLLVIKNSESHAVKMTRLPLPVLKSPTATLPAH